MDKIRKEKVQKKKQRDLSQLPLTDKNIASICKRFQVSYNISNEAVFIRTAFSRWIVLIQDDKVVKLYHENYKPSRSEYLKRQKKKFTEGYHLQKLPSEYFYEVVRYIKSHDQDTVKRMAKKNRVEELLERVETELKSKNLEEKQVL